MGCPRGADLQGTPGHYISPQKPGNLPHYTFDLVPPTWPEGVKKDQLPDEIIRTTIDPTRPEEERVVRRDHYILKAPPQ